MVDGASHNIYLLWPNDNSDFVVDKKNVYVKNVAKVFKEWLKSRGDYKESTGKT